MDERLVVKLLSWPVTPTAFFCYFQSLWLQLIDWTVTVNRGNKVDTPLFFTTRQSSPVSRFNTEKDELASHQKVKSYLIIKRTNN